MFVNLLDLILAGITVLMDGADGSEGFARIITEDRPIVACWDHDGEVIRLFGSSPGFFALVEERHIPQVG